MTYSFPLVHKVYQKGGDVMANTFKISFVFKGVLLAVIFAFVSSLILGLILSFTSLPESDLVVDIVYSLSIFLAAAYSTFKAGNKGLVYGIFIGLGFVFLLLILSAILQPESPLWINIGEKTIYSVIAGGVGGILGVIFHRA